MVEPRPFLHQDHSLWTQLVLSAKSYYSALIITKDDSGCPHLALRTLGMDPSLGWGCPEHCRALSSIPGLHPLHARKPPLTAVVTTTNVSRHRPVCPGAGPPPWRATRLRPHLYSTQRFQIHQTTLRAGPSDSFLSCSCSHLASWLVSPS